MNARLCPSACLAALVVLPLLVSSAIAAERISWMYDAEVPVMNQSSQARVAAAHEGLRQVLGRLTGQGDALTLNVSGVSADRLMTRFSYGSEIVDGRRQPHVKLSFNPGPTLGMVRNAGLPVWGSSRPLVRFYLLVEGDDGVWQPLAPGDPAERAMQKQAWKRGIRLSIEEFTESAVPVQQMLLGEPESPESISPGADQGGAGFTVAPPIGETRSVGNAGEAGSAVDATMPGPKVRPPPEPFLPGVIPAETELVVVGELRAPTDVATPSSGEPPETPVPVGTVGTLVAEQFRYAWGPEREPIRIASGTIEEQAVQLVDRVVDRMADTLGVPWVNPQPQALTVSGVHEVEDYATLMRYLDRLEYVEQVNLLRSAPNRIELTLRTPAAPELLDRLFLVDGLLVRNEANAGAERIFEWRD